MTRFTCAALLFFVASPAHAYTVGTAFTEPCHERLTSSALEDFVERGRFAVPEIPGGPTSRVARHFVELYGYETMSPRGEAILFALILGVRDPDSEGISPTDLSGSRYLHANTEGQAQHALRRPEDDGPEGDAAAILALREEIENALAEAQDWFARPPSEQLMDVDYFLESYGRVRIRVWAPAFFLGRALHTVQDSFSHALRTSDMRRLVHIFNYIEAITGAHDQARDGLRHSSEMDACYVGGASSSLFLAAREASTHLVSLVLGEARDGRLGDPTVALDRWLQYEPGCTIENDYCVNAFVETALTKTTAPVGSCNVTPITGTHAAWLLLCFALLLRRRILSRTLLVATLVLGAACKPTPLLEEELETTDPCGGDPKGAWYFAATTEAAPRNEPQDDCPLIRDEERIQYSGRLAFEDDGDLISGVTVRRHVIQVRDASCDAACNTDAQCITRGDVCHCLDVRLEDWLPGEPGSPTRWATQGDVLELLDDEGSIVLATGYCVEDTPEGEMGWSAIGSPSTGQRLQRIPE